VDSDRAPAIVFPVPVGGGRVRRGTSGATTGRRRRTDRGSRAAAAIEPSASATCGRRTASARRDF